MTNKLISKKELSKLLIFFLIWRLGLFIVAALANKILLYDPSFPYADSLLSQANMPQWLYSWANFDGIHYLTIARLGYKEAELIQAFFPLYPLLISFPVNFLRHITIGKYILSGLIFSNLSALILMLLSFSFIKNIYNSRIAWLSILIMFLFPSSFFFGAMYSEAFFLILVFACFYAAKKDKWYLSGLFAALASITRIIGIFLLPALLIELWEQNHQSKIFPSIISILKTKRQEIFWIAWGSLGLLIYMLYLKIEFHDPLFFFHVQSEFGSGRQESLILYPQVIWRYLKILLTYRPINLNYYAYLQEFIISTLGLIALIFSYKYIRKSFLFFALAAFFLPTLTGTFSSMPRYILASFPIFIYLAKLLEARPKLKYLYFGISTFLLIFNTILFIQGYWVA